MHNLSFPLPQSEALLDSVKEHRALISDLQNSKDQTMFITASKDSSAKAQPSTCAHAHVYAFFVVVVVV